jgi:hypothetical protein
MLKRVIILLVNLTTHDNKKIKESELLIEAQTLSQ